MNDSESLTSMPKKRGRPSKADIVARQLSVAAPLGAKPYEQLTLPLEQASPTPAAPAKKRGRPSKADIAARQAVAITPALQPTPPLDPAAPPARRRGRPSKADIAARQATTALPTPEQQPSSPPYSPPPATRPIAPTSAPIQQINVVRESLSPAEVQRNSPTGNQPYNNNYRANANNNNRPNSRSHHPHNQNQNRPYQQEQNGYGKQGKNNKFKKGKNKNRPYQQCENQLPTQQPNQGKPTNFYSEPEPVNGLLEISPKGQGFLREASNDFIITSEAVCVTMETIRQHSLRHATWIHGMARRSNKGFILTDVTSVNGSPPEQAAAAPFFEELKAVNPSKRIIFETDPTRLTTRTVDLVAPVARGQRGLIVSPPRAGKTILLQHIAEAVQDKYKDTLHLIVLLIDERPEEVTEFKRSLPQAEIYASSNDGKVKDHTRLAELCIERAKRLVEQGKHVFVLMDSITRLARAYNNAEAGSGRTMSGGIDSRALEMPRRLFAAARNTRLAGSLTIIATALIETNSRMDDLIFQEFKGTGNMELVLNRRIAESYIYPAIDILKSGTRREELILPETWLYRIHLIRRALAGLKPIDAMERLLSFMNKSPSNVEMLMHMKIKA